MIKRLEMTDPKSCLSKAADDEPIFVLRAQDRFASSLVRAWLLFFLAAPDTDPMSFKAGEALRCAEAMEAWAERRTPD